MPDRSPELRARELLLVFLAYAAVTAWLLWPLPLVAATHLPDRFGEAPLVRADLHLIVWILAWGAHALFAQPFHFFDANAFHPAPSSLAYSEHLIGYLPLFAPTYLATGNPVLAANVLLLLLYPLRGVATYAFARLFVPAPAAALAGAILAFPFGLGTPLKLHLVGVFWIPLAFVFTERWLDQARARWAILLCIALFLQATSSFYLGYALAIAYGTYLLVTLVGRRASLDVRRLTGLALAGGIAVLAAGALALPYLALRDVGIVPSYDPARDAPAGFSTARGQIHGLFVQGGTAKVMVGALVALALLPPWRGRLRAVVTGAALVTAGLLLASGPEPEGQLFAPYRFLMEWLPGFATTRSPSRFLFIAELGFALLAALGFARLFAALPVRLPRGAAWAASAALGTALALGLNPSAMPVRAETVGDTLPAAYRWLGEHGAGRPLLELPRPKWPEAARRMLLSTSHWLPIVDGYSGYPLPTDDRLQALAQGLPSASALQKLVDTADIGWILVHAADLSPERRRAWSKDLPAGLERVKVFGSDLLLRVTRGPRNDRRARFLSTTETLAGLPRHPVGPSCPGEIRLGEAPAAPWRASSGVTIQLVISNRSDVAWPGDGVVPLHLVQLRSCFEREAHAGCATAMRPLGRDIGAGETVSLRTEYRTPQQPGPYTLVIDLVQVGGEPLANCGTAPLRVPVTIGRPPQPGAGASAPPARADAGGQRQVDEAAGRDS